MRSAVVIAAIAGLTTANPVVSRQTGAQTGIDLSAFDADKTPVKTGPAVGATFEQPTYNSEQGQAAAAEDAIKNPVIPAKRDLMPRTNGCDQKEPNGYGPVSNPDTYDQFMSDPLYSNIAQNAPVPDGYSQSFADLSGSAEGPGYLGLYTMQSFNTIECQQHCDAADSCYGFNVFMERNPSYTPSDTCENPPSVTNFKCTLWGLPITPQTATNVGQWRNQFHVGIRGSNGYVKLAPPPPQDGFNGPIEFGGSTQAPYSYMGVKFFSGPYDPSQCASACKATTQYDHDHPRADGTYDACNFFNSFILSEDGVPQGTYCAMYTQSWDKSYSTNVGQWRGSDYFSVSQSYGYSLATPDSGVISS
ncbi:hypothetical protein CCHL11_04527 [Colletotrichum chlorophyti]|uniref:Apple domain-containing protein n=1 Tax=Colletotrichum chlorophyti TaxID=708187 RepID=A0A1Q8RRM8_9PEZI|nr:hypothetical protein CCHL11_04527 [Colletotrichum chlorophyti]